MILPLLAAVFNVGQVSSPFFLVWRCAIVFELGCCTCLWVSHLQSFPRSGYPDGFWTFGLRKREWSLCSGRDGTIVHRFLHPLHIWGCAAGWAPQRSPITPNVLPCTQAFLSQGIVMISCITLALSGPRCNWGCADRPEGNTENRPLINTFFPLSA